MNDKPLVSIIIPVYNGGKYMQEAIDSALNQTYSNIEVLVINDGSRDDGETEKIALSYGDKIRYFHKENGGVSSALNLGIQNMKGEYFSWLSHDDAYTPQKVEKQIELLQKNNKQNVIIKCACDFIDENSKFINKKEYVLCEKEVAWEDALIQITKRGMNGCSLLIPKKVFLEVGVFDERLRFAQDTLMWWKIFLERYTLITTSYVGVLSRIHGQQLTRTASALYHHDANEIGKIIIPKFADASTKSKNMLYEYAKSEAIHGNFETVKKCFVHAANKNLFSFKEMIKLVAFGSYGCIRPWIRVAYYKLKYNIKLK